MSFRVRVCSDLLDERKRPRFRPAVRMLGAAPGQGPLVRAIVAQNGMESTVSPFETTLSDRHLPFHGQERR